MTRRFVRFLEKFWPAEKRIILAVVNDVGS